MKIQLKLVLAFLIVTFSITAVGYILISQLTKIAQPLTSDIPKSIDDIATASELDGYAQFIRYYDEVLTQSARNYAFTQDKKWQERYMTIEPQLDKIIKSAANKGNEKDKEIFSQINDANLALVEMEYRALELVDNGKADEAIRILESTEYWDQKRIYEQGLRDYKAIRGFEYEQALQTSTHTLDSITEETQKSVSESVQLATISVAIILILATSLGIIIARHIVKPITQLNNASKKIAKGDLDIKIEVQGDDEIHDLADSFNMMAKSLNNSTKLLSKAEQKYRNLYEGSPYLYRTIDTNGIILDCNQSYADHLGYSKAELIGSSIFDTTAPESIDQMRESFETWKRQGRVDDREVWFKRKDKTTFPVLISASNLYDENGKLIGSNTVIRDMLEIYKARKKIQESEAKIREQLEELKKLSMVKDGFLAMITHELRAPFIPIINYADLLLSQKFGTLNETQIQKLEIIKSSTESLSRMLSDLLDAQKLELGQLTLKKDSHDISEIINSTIMKLKPNAESRNITITAELKKNITCLCDKTRIEEVLINLISNAIDFCPPEKGKIHIKLSSENNCAKIIVKDNGIGIEKNKLDRLFVKFYQLDVSETMKRSGSGLGLSICKGIIENHNGKIWAESEGRNKGTVFHILLPEYDMRQSVETPRRIKS